MDEIKMGSRVRARALVKRTYQGDNYKWKRMEVFRIDGALFLGWTHKRDGYESKDEYGYGNPYDFVTTGTVKLAVLQPLSKNGRWRKPVYALPEDVEVMCG